jgi:hypothetical protein
MTTLDFETSLGANGTLKVPDDVALQLKALPSFRVIVLVPESDEDEQAWRHLGIEQFVKGYADSDSIYDDL